MNDINEQSATLVAHCGTHKVTRDALMQIPIPERTRTHQPLAHFEIIEVLEEALSYRYLKIVRDEYAVSQDGMKMFGVMDLNSEFNGGRFSIGVRNSNDKSMRLALTAGVRVFVCDNMAFSGDFTPLLHKHTRNLELRDSISIAVDRIHRGFEPFKRQIKAMREQLLSEDEVRLIIYQAFLDRTVKGIPKFLMPLVHEHYFRPQHEAFTPRNLWSLSNAFTSAFKKLAPVKQFEITARLGKFLTDVQKGLAEKNELELHLPQTNGQDADDLTDENINSDNLSESVGQPAVSKTLQFPMPPDNTGNFAGAKNDITENRKLLPISNLSEPDNFDEDDMSEDEYADEMFDDYFDEELAEEEIDEATVRLADEYDRKMAA